MYKSHGNKCIDVDTTKAWTKQKKKKKEKKKLHPNELEAIVRIKDKGFHLALGHLQHFNYKFVYTYLVVI